MNSTFRKLLSLAALALLAVSSARAEYLEKNLYTDLVAPILEAKCVSCHGEDKMKGKLRLDSFEHIMKGGSEGEAAIPGKASDSGIIFRAVLPLDDDEHMPPEDKPQLTEAEFDVLTYWITAGAKADASIGDLKPGDKEIKFIAAAFSDVAKGGAQAAAVPKKADAPKELDEATKKAVAETIGRVDEAGASLMAIAQDTPDLRFSALNVQKDFDDKSLQMLSPAAGQIRWMDIARTKVTDAGLATVGGMKRLTRLHLEGTAITDAGLEKLKGLQNLEYLNLYDTAVTDAGLAKLAGLKNLKKVFVWQTKVTDAGAKKLAAAIPNVNVNMGWKAEKPVTVAAVAAPKPAPKPAPTKKPEPKPKPAPTKPAPKPAPPTPEPLEGSIAKAIEDADETLAAAKQKAASARKAATEAVKAAEAAQKAAVEADNEAKKAQMALELLQKAAAALK